MADRAKGDLESVGRLLALKALSTGARSSCNAATWLAAMVAACVGV